jgi:hypothetical protein
MVRVKGGLRARKAEILAAICEPTVEKMWEPRHLTTLWASTACYRDSFTFTYIWYTSKKFDDICFTRFLRRITILCCVLFIRLLFSVKR